MPTEAHPHRFLFVLVTLLCALGLAPAAAAKDRASDADQATEPGVEERWYLVELAGSPAGWMWGRRDTDDAGTITTDTEMLLRVRRGAITLEVGVETQSVETAAGDPISMTSTQDFGGSSTTSVYEFQGDTVRVTTTQGGQVINREVPRPEGEWLMPAAAERAARAAAAGGEDRFTVTTLDPAAGLSPITTLRAEPTPAKIEITDADGASTVEGTRWTVTSTALPGIKSTETLDAEGEMLASSTNLGGFDLVMTLSDRATALGESNSAEAPEMMVSTFVRATGIADGKIDRPRMLKHATYRVSVADGDLPPLPTAAGQTVEVIGDRAARVSVSARTQAASKPQVATDADRGSSSMINLDDPELRRMHLRATAGLTEDASLLARAEAIRRFVHRVIARKDLGVGFGSASETARSRRGDCTEHAVLLAALLRLDGTPARIASGLIYADAFAGAREIFGYHMWTRALVEIDGVPTWIDLDATLRGTRFDAAHIALDESPLADDGLTTTYARIATALGRLAIEVESLDHD
ncbi:MAG: transglutaminase domain-containing protein [Planctomycetota bacterium]